MLDAGLPLVQCLEILGEQEEDKNFREIIQAVRTDVESGASLADAMRKHPKAFNNLYSSMIAAGEAGGILDIILQRLATYIEKVVRCRRQVKSALIYPVDGASSSPSASSASFCGRSSRSSPSCSPASAASCRCLTRMVVNASNFVGRFGIFLIVGAHR